MYSRVKVAVIHAKMNIHNIMNIACRHHGCTKQCPIVYPLYNPLFFYIPCNHNWYREVDQSECKTSVHNGMLVTWTFWDQWFTVQATLSCIIDTLSSIHAHIFVWFPCTFPAPGHLQHMEHNIWAWAWLAHILTAMRCVLSTLKKATCCK